MKYHTHWMRRLTNTHTHTYTGASGLVAMDTISGVWGSIGTLHNGLLAPVLVWVRARLCDLKCVCVCNDVTVSVCVPSTFKLSVIRITKDSLYHTLLTRSVLSHVPPSLPPSPLLLSCHPHLSPPHIWTVRVVGQTPPAQSGPEAHLSGCNLCREAERRMGLGRRERQRWRERIRKKDGMKRRVMVKVSGCKRSDQWFIPNPETKYKRKLAGWKSERVVILFQHYLSCTNNYLSGELG